MSRRPWILLALTALISGCTMGPDYRRPDVEPPAEYRDETAAESQASLANLEWWVLFEDPALQELIRTALEHNKDLQAAYWRVEEARARLGFTKADLWPTFDYLLGVGVTDPSDVNPPFPGDRTENYFAGVGISWEIDLWGKLRRSNEAARAELLATEWGRRALNISLVAEVARLYFLLRDFDGRLEIARETLESRRASTELIRRRFEGGVVSQLDVRQAEIQEETAAAAVPLFERSAGQLENALSVILGREPGPIVRGMALVDQQLPNETPAGLPSGLLERRPDVRQAEEVLERIQGAYEKTYYGGVIAERWGKALLRRGTHLEGASGWFQKAMAAFESADALSSAENDEALLHWNACARLMNRLESRRGAVPGQHQDALFVDEIPPAR